MKAQKKLNWAVALAVTVGSLAATNASACVDVTDGRSCSGNRTCFSVQNNCSEPVKAFVSVEHNGRRILPHGWTSKCIRPGRKHQMYYHLNGPGNYKVLILNTKDC